MSAPARPRLRSLRRTLACLLLAACAGPALAEDFVYVVQPGDNPWNLTRRYLKSIDYWPRIQDYNRILEPETIRPGSVLRIPVAWMRGERGGAEVIDVRGEVEVRSAGGSEALSPGMRVLPGMQVRSGADSSLTLEFPDGSRSLVGADTTFGMRKLERLRASGAQQLELQLERGYIENLVNPVRSGGRYIIQTPAAVAAVRGTDFRITAVLDGVRAETLEGEVALQNARGQTRLPAGRGSYAERGKFPERSSELLPAPDLGGLPTVIDRVPFRIPIEPVAGALRYRTQLSPAGGFTVLASDRSADEAAALGSGELPDGRYRVRVRAVDGRGLEGLDGEREVLIDARPEPPFPSVPPADGFATEDKVRFSWAHDPQSTAYHFQLAADTGFERILMQRDDLREAGLVLDEELPAGDYFWRIGLSTADEGRGPYSDVQRFRRPPPGPQAEPPEVDGDTLQLRWRAHEGADAYQVEFARDADFAAPAHRHETRAPELAMERPEGGVWHVRIRSQEPGGPPGPWSKPQQVEVPHDHWRALLVLLPLLLVP